MSDLNFISIPKGINNEEILIYFHLSNDTNFTQEEYEGRKKFECFCSIRTLSDNTGLTTRIVNKTLKSLEELGYIKLITKGKPPKTPSKYKLIFAESIIEKSNKEDSKNIIKKDLNNPKEKPIEPKKIISEVKDHTEEIFSFWNQKEIITHRTLTNEIYNSIKKALEIYSIDKIKEGINNYCEILNSSYFFSYKWSLKDFLNRKNGISSFVNEGSTKVNYDSWKNKNDKKNISKSKEDKKLVNFTQRDYDFEQLEKELLGWA